MVTVSRDELHRVVEQLSDDRLTAAAELLESLALHDERVSVWLQNLNPAQESEIADSLRREYGAHEWVTDQTVEAWIDSLGDGCDPEP